MQAIIIGLGSAGDVYPNIGLALAIRRRGHAVLFVGPEVFRQTAEQNGLEFLPIGTREEYDTALADPDLWHPFRSFSVVARRLIVPAVRPLYDIIASRFDASETVVAAPGFAFGARIANEKLGVPLATVHLQPVLFRSAIRPACFGFPDILGNLPRFLRNPYFRLADLLFVDKYLADPVNRFRRELGLAPVSRLFNSWIHSPELVLGLFPDWFAPIQPDWPPHTKLTGFPLWDDVGDHRVSADLDRFLADGEKPILFTAGSAMAHARRFFEVSCEICIALGVRGILLTQYAEQIPAALPPGVQHFAYIPFTDVLPRVAAIVHHGGIGTTAQAMAAAIPQLVIPFAHDQPDNAIRVKELGIGDYLLPRDYGQARGAQSLAALLNLKEKCEEVANRISYDSLEKATTLIESLARGRHDSPPVAPQNA